MSRLAQLAWHLGDNILLLRQELVEDIHLHEESRA